MSDPPTRPDPEPAPPTRPDPEPQRPARSDPEAGLPEFRASDAEREQAAEALRVAASEGRLTVDELEERLSAAYAVRTRRELEQLIADVSERPLGYARHPAATADRSALTVREGPGGTRWVVSIMSGNDRRGRWRVGRRVTVLNVMGGGDIDLNDAELADREIQLNVYSIMGGGDIMVPHGVDVQVSNIALMGGNDVELGAEDVPPGGPTIHIRLVSIMGGTKVVRGRKESLRQRLKQQALEKANRSQLGR